MPFGSGLLGPVGSIPINPVVFGAEILGTFLGSLLGSLFGGGDLGAVKMQVDKLTHDLIKTGDMLKRFAWTIAYALGTLLQALHDIWVGFLDQLWTLLKKIAHALVRLLTDVFPRLLRWLSILQHRLDELYAKYVRPILNYLQIVRKYLGILAALHVPFARKLDQWIVRIEGQIIAPYLRVRQWLGAMGNYWNVLLTAGGIIQRAMLLNSMFAWGADWINLWWVMQSGQVAGRPAPAPIQSAGPDPLPVVQADMAVFVASGGGKYGAAAALAQGQFISILP